MAIGPRKRVAIVGALLWVAAFAAAIVASDVLIALALLAALQLVTVLGGAFLLVSLDRRRRGAEAELRARLDEHAEAAPFDELLAREHETSQRLDELGRTADERQAALLEAVGAIQDEVSHLHRSHQRFERWARRSPLDEFTQHEALLSLYHEMRPGRALPSMRGWAASPDLLLWCWRQVLSQAPRTILECGSGVSTVVLASACRRLGEGQVISLEHDADFAEATRQLLDEHDVAAWADVRTAPLDPLPGHDRPWYRREALPAGPIDLALIDGPPAGSRDPLGRLPAIDLISPLLSEAAVVVFDDARREGERTIVERWLDAFPDMRLEDLGHEKGTAVLRRMPRSGGDPAQR